MYQDTIAAISTALGEGGIGIVRLTGAEARSVVEKAFTGQLTHRHLSYGHITDPANGQVVDEVLVSFMAAPHTYTREDVVEINCHGGAITLQRTLEVMLRCGARMALPGEFTLRAFLNGRIDLAQAEAVLDVVRAKTDASLRLAMQGLDGRLSAAIQEIRGQLLPALAYLSAKIDFPEDEVESQNVLEPLTESLHKLQQLILNADRGIVYRQGVKTAIVGRPNVGKSSLLNRLLRQERAIVTPIPGTTRDTVEEIVNLQGIPFVLVDTAGIIQSKDLVESLGIERSRRAMDQADFILLVLDISEPVTGADRDIIDSIGDKSALVIANKCDLPQQAEVGSLPWETVFTSALTGEGMADLEERMLGAVLKGRVTTSEALLVNNPRHKSALERSEKHLSQALSAIEARMPDDCVTIDLTAALNSLGEITGETVQEDLLETIFGSFCIGK